MRKLFSTIFLITVLSVAAFAADGHINSPGTTTCIAGHINSPGVVCTPPEDDEDDENRGVQPDDKSFSIIIRNFLADYNPFGYFLN